jgi:hypothetical protein
MSRKLLSILIPCLILTLVALCFFDISRLFKPAIPTPTSPLIPEQQPSEPQIESTTSIIIPLPAIPSIAPLETPVPPVEIPEQAMVIVPSQEQVAEPTILFPDSPLLPLPDANQLAPEISTVTEAITEPNQVIKRFLTTDDFEERLSYVITHLSGEELQNGLLSQKWPSAEYTLTAQIPRTSERLTEFYYEVRFGDNTVGFPTVATLLLIKRADEAAKVILDPLLDTVGGRLRAYAIDPTSKPKDFYVIMDARVKCTDDTIPNGDQKCMFYLRSHTTGQNIATAFAHQNSPTHQKFDNPLSGLKWKNPMPVVLTLQWNTSEDDARPFLEVIDIKSQNWRP